MKTLIINYSTPETVVVIEDSQRSLMLAAIPRDVSFIYEDCIGAKHGDGPLLRHVRVVRRYIDLSRGELRIYVSDKGDETNQDAAKSQR